MNEAKDMSMDEAEKTTKAINRIEEYLDAENKRETEAWRIRKYYQLVRILEEAKQLVKELDSEINGIKPDFSALGREKFYQPFHQGSDRRLEE